MNWLFDMDKPLMRGLSVVTDLIILNILTFICCLPVFTAGAAFTALYTIVIRIIRNEDGSVVKDYFRAFRSNFKKATLLWLGFLALIVILFVVGCEFFIRYSVKFRHNKKGGNAQ